MPSRRKNRRKSPRRRNIIKRSLRFTPKFVIRERVDTIEDTLDSVFQSNTGATGRIPRDVANIIAEYDNFDDGGKRSYWRNEIRDYDEYKKTGRTGRENNPYMKYKIMPVGNGLVHHQEWYENGQQKTDCYYNDWSKLYHGNCKQWNEYGHLIYDRTFDRGDEKFMSKITGKGSKINLYKVHDE
jgi:hypothetical protein